MLDWFIADSVVVTSLRQIVNITAEQTTLSIQPDQSQIPSCRSQSLPRAEYAFSCPKTRSAKRLFPILRVHN